MTEHFITGHGPLGEQTHYVSRYDPEQLFPIRRAETRASLGIRPGDLPFYGVDFWTGYEVSWLDERGKPQVALARFQIPCDSECLVESKSFKLYLNSFNQSVFARIEEVHDCLVQDLSRAAGATVGVELTPLARARLAVQEPAGDCLDDLPVTIEHYHPAPENLSAPKPIVSETLYSNLLKSNCPVTGQPDWATVEIRYRGPGIDREGLLRYIVSFREHQDFHEHCVERMFLDISERCRPEFLQVYARYTRRGGLDINPLRCSEALDTPLFQRLIRQ